MPNWSGIWDLSAVVRARSTRLWPQQPGAPTSVSAEAGDAEATVTFTAPTDTGVPAGITGYKVISDPGSIEETGSSSPITVTGLTNGTSYTFTVQATNGVQYGAAGGPSGAVSPQSQIAVFGGGKDPFNSNVIQYVSISSEGNTSDFGDLSTVQAATGLSSATRGLFSIHGSSVIDYVTIASTGNSTTFGTLTQAGGFNYRQGEGACSSATRGVIAGGFNGSSRTSSMEYVTFASTGNGVSFGNLTVGRDNLAGCQSPTRGIFAAGYNGSSDVNTIDYITIASTGNAIDFGDRTEAKREIAACSSSTRGVFAGGYTASNVIDYVTIASTGNATNFGDLTVSRNKVSGTSSEVKGVFAGGVNSGSTTINTIDKVTIATTGNASDFGDLYVAVGTSGACSNAHGGLA